MPTKRDVIERAYRFGGIVSTEEPMTAAQHAEAEKVLEGIWAETDMEAQIPWTTDAVPQEAFLPLAMVLSHDLCIENDVQPRMSRGAAVLRLLAVIRPDDRAEISAPEYF